VDVQVQKFEDSGIFLASVAEEVALSWKCNGRGLGRADDRRYIRVTPRRAVVVDARAGAFN
jgi:hypothetical protein